MKQAVGESPEWVGLRLGPEPTEGMGLGTFRRLSWILRGKERRGIQEWAELG